MARVGPDAIVNCAAYNAVDEAEDRPVEALQANAFAVRTLARAAAAHGAVLVHYSSDFVFDGKTTRPYVEEDRPNPQSVYAASKMLGEWFAADASKAYVLRVESLFGSVGGSKSRGSAAAIVEGIKAGRDVPVFTDRTVSPTFVVDAAAATRAMLERQVPPGLYHCVNTGQCSWYEFAEETARLLGLQPRLVPMTLGTASLRAKRPAYCALANDKLRAHGVAMPDWRDGLRRWICERVSSRGDSTS